MNRLTPLYETTIKLKELLEQKIDAKDRESVISQINSLIEKRGEQMKALTPPYSDMEKETGRALVDLNDGIQHKMQQLFHELKLEMKQIKKQKQSNRKYSDPYKNVQSKDGMFLDSKN
ncbi:flagellar protein FliT [Virgibacillus sp. AGTR]|uniref:flagellar protein FliT n=1 Tax=Virgibacillus sp. AGTR TaxID=2812055 RepID=UPI0019651AF9|nr:flagellar protein FliT [Virgibacillus sp. AGTR]MCC2251053.1 flagellar protein FliT [Virgibacillus sp. AGTR]QRZ18034.1 flagellar protein FliT [Virgibacillus sp. AGTR]